jgi:hypothetical protein
LYDVPPVHGKGDVSRMDDVTMQHGGGFEDAAMPGRKWTKSDPPLYDNPSSKSSSNSAASAGGSDVMRHDAIRSSDVTMRHDAKNPTLYDTPRADNSPREDNPPQDSEELPPALPERRPISSTTFRPGSKPVARQRRPSSDGSLPPHTGSASLLGDEAKEAGKCTSCCRQRRGMMVMGVRYWA